MKCTLPGLLLVSASTWAADECQLNLSETRLDFGLMNRAVALVPGPERLLGERRLSLTLNCAQPTDMQVFYRALVADAERFRFTERGSYRLNVRDAIVDGQAVELGLLAGKGQPPITTGTALTWRPEHGIVPMRAGVPLSGRSLSVQIEASAWAREDAARVRDAVTWDSSGLFDATGAGRSREANLLARFAPAACTPSLSNGGNVALGKLSVADLNASRETVLAPRQTMLSVTCDAPTAFTIRMQDNRQGTATGTGDDTAYGLGLDTRQQKIGRYRLIFDPARTTADSFAQVFRTDSATGAQPWSSASAAPIAVGALYHLGFTASAGSVSGPAAIQNLNTTLSLETVIAPLGSLDLGSEVRLDGSGTLEINYL
ncbi:MAG: Protein GltF [Pseudomonas sp.]|nr:MAG: Protein GltF [Pseudomonas sp.]